MQIAKSMILRLISVGALFPGLLGSSVLSAFAQKDSRGWDGTSSSIYSTPSYDSTSTGSSSGSYGAPSHGVFAPFGRVAPSGSSSNRSVPYGNPNAKYTPAPNLSFQEQQIRNKQREQQLMQQQASQPVNPSTLQAQRWQDEWRQQHPGESMPNAGQLQKMHSTEIQNSITNGFAAMRQRQSAKSREEYDLATQISKRNAAQSGVPWSKAQFDRDYEQSHIDHAKAYLEAVRQAGEIGEMQEEDRKRREIYRP
ncbi:MAG: hypothetical protein P4L53_20610 [Candidatus Obscuribacterales bacterium]|nr:hypothetical protein [Candidatus Obscuribacterales bacterium]